MKFLTSHEVNNILVFENHNHVGDILCSLSLFSSLRKKFPQAHITLVAVPTSYQIPFFEINPYLDEVLIFDKSSLRKLFFFIKKLRGRSYSFGIIPSTKAISRTLHLLNIIPRVKLRVGVKSIDGKRNPWQILLNVKKDFVWKDKHQLERNLEVAKQIGCELTNEEMQAIKFEFTREDFQFAQNYLKDKFGIERRKVIAIHPGAGKNANVWPSEKFIDLISQLYAKHNNYFLVTKGLIDETIVGVISEALKQKNIEHEILFNCPVKKLGAVLSKVDLFITNDTGTMHIGGFSDARMISLFGPTNPLEWAPKGKNKFYINSKSGRIEDIQVNDVLEVANKILDENYSS